MLDFEEALNKGMGCKITDEEKVQIIDEADWLIAVGINEGETAAVDTLLAIVGEKNEDISGLLNPPANSGQLDLVDQINESENLTSNIDGTTLIPLFTNEHFDEKSIFIQSMPHISKNHKQLIINIIHYTPSRLYELVTSTKIFPIISYNFWLIINVNFIFLRHDI